MPALREYLVDFPAGEKLILQRFVPHAGEVAVLYARLPGAESGRILTLTLRTDGVDRDARHHITPELEARIDAIARSMSEFHYGRFDLRFASIDELMRGENFSIIEISGVCGGADRHCEPVLPLVEVYRRAVDQQRIVFLIGDKNRARGFKPAACADVVKSLIRVHSRAAVLRPRPEHPAAGWAARWTRGRFDPTLPSCPAGSARRVVVRAALLTRNQ